MYSRIKEILSTPILRQWCVYKLSNLTDKGVRNSYEKPNYLKSRAIEIGEGEVSLDLVKYRPRLSFEETTSKLDFDFKYIKKDKLLGIASADLEFIATYYRFKWLPLYLEFGGEIAPVASIIKDWCQEEIPFFDNAYTTAERISNWGLFISRTDLFEIISSEDMDLIRKRVLEDAKSIQENFEYFGLDLTGNHLLNNARGLIWASFILNSPKLCEDALAIVDQEQRRIFISEGMNREGSSHYQFLISRNVFESIYIAEKMLPEKNLCEIKNRAVQMAYSCVFFKGNKHIPLIGDISPDYPPAWFNDVPETILGFFDKSKIELIDENCDSGWSSHFTVKKFKRIELDLGFKRGEFLFLQESRASLYVHINEQGSPIIPSHSHCDTGSPTLFIDGEEIVCDPGRLNYTIQEKRYVGSYSHNVVIVDGVAPEELRRGIFGKGFLKWRFPNNEALIDIDKNEACVNIFSYQYKNINIKRKYKLYDNKAEFTIDVLGSGVHTIELPLYVNKNFDSSKIEFPREGRVVENFPKGLRKKAIAYNKTKDVNAILWKSKQKLPWSGSIIINY